MLARKSLSAFASFLPLPLPPPPPPLPFPLPRPLPSPPSRCWPTLLTIFPSSWSTMLWASRMPCATWSWLQGRTNKRRVNHNFLDWPDIRGGAIKGKGGGEGCVSTHSASLGACAATIAAPILSTAAPASAISACAWMVSSITACCGG